jgi:hypothetical protein
MARCGIYSAHRPFGPTNQSAPFAGSARRAGLLVSRRDPVDRDHLGLVSFGVRDVSTRSAAEPDGALVVADEDPGMVLPVTVVTHTGWPSLNPWIGSPIGSA